MSKQPSTKEKSLLNAIGLTLRRYIRYEDSEPCFVAMPEVKDAFQRLARRTARLITQQGTKKTNADLLQAAKNIRDIGEDGWHDAGKLGHAFNSAIREYNSGKPQNPFAKMKL